MTSRHAGGEMATRRATARAASTAYGRQMAKGVGAQAVSLVADAAWASVFGRAAFGNRQTRRPDKALAGVSGALSVRAQVGVPMRLSMNRPVSNLRKVRRKRQAVLPSDFLSLRFCSRVGFWFSFLLYFWFEGWARQD